MRVLNRERSGSRRAFLPGFVSYIRFSILRVQRTDTALASRFAVLTATKPPCLPLLTAPWMVFRLTRRQSAAMFLPPILTRSLWSLGLQPSQDNLVSSKQRAVRHTILPCHLEAVSYDPGCECGKDAVMVLQLKIIHYLGTFTPCQWPVSYLLMSIKASRPRHLS